MKKVTRTPAQVKSDAVKTVNKSIRDKQAAPATITEKEFTVLKSIVNSQYQDVMDEDIINNPIWTWDVSDSSFRGKTFSGIVSSLTEKKLIGSHDEPKPDESTIWITEAGMDAYQEYLTRTVDKSTPAKKATPKKDPKKQPVKPKKQPEIIKGPSMTRFESIIITMRQMVRGKKSEWVSIDLKSLAEESTRLYEENGGSFNLKQSLHVVNIINQTLIPIGSVRKVDSKTIEILRSI